MNNSFKKVVVTGLTLAMVMGGSTAAFASNDKGKGNDKDKDRGRDWNNVIETKYNDKNNDKNNKDININNLNVKNLNIKLSFDDVKGADVEWAARYIASLASKRVFEGYEDGTFQPRKTITRIEAITAAVRLMGLRDQAESAEAKAANLNFKDADKLKNSYSWATGYVSVALQNDLFEESDDMINPGKEADRLWATTLLIKAMKLQDEAKTKMNTKLTFKDANKIPAGSVGYIALAIEKNLIDGYEDNTFRPNNPVTRAELAALLDRTGSQLPDNASISGTISSTVSNNLLTLTVKGQPYSVELDSGAFIFRNGAKVAASELRTGDEVIVRTYGGKAIFVEVKKLGNGSSNQLPDNTNFTASVNAAVSNNILTVIKDGQSYSNELASNVSIIRNGQSVAASELRVGDEVLVRTSGGKVVFVAVTTLANDQQANFIVNGTYNSYTTNSSDQVNSISINKILNDGSVQNNVYYNTTSNVTFLYNTSNGTIQGDRSQLTSNRSVELRGTNNVVHTIVIK
ncbi:S-layer homology domain-containing protein [Paenibacillus sp. LMG 31456]|uniref:S-layer homology domain-containing protein n=1 Tax=Paenibacillus foliorum TaxID=2654974 RepID=A0A972GSW1_9BACL|nr:S-layer homology domain-containing protein [Paenibacillus foliorum]NOU96274.1 S-layer homology domain-containing protein [Paenibacillus foliorum]